MKRNLLIAIGVIAVATTVWAMFFRGSDDDLIRKAVARAAKAVEVVPGENPVMRPGFAPSSSKCSRRTCR